MDPSPHILIVDDEPTIRGPLATYLTQNGFRLSTAGNASEAKKVLESSAIELVVLDIMMPGENGLSLCRHLRETKDIPTILLTAMAEETDRIVGLEMGADDYVVKPFNPRELLARIKSVLRRANSLPKKEPLVFAKTITFDPWRLYVAQRELMGNDGVAIPLSTSEFGLLMVFLQHPQMVLTRDQLLDLTRNRAAEMFDRSIDIQVSRLRKKIERDPKNPTLIKTVWGGGYTFTGEIQTE
ncbi:response regulator [Candidatus Nitronereus thalassa]|uniref:Response regulator n=1 Tax=Candidatus Nitronereus thalassa TaxID=3020898 RepID=A0ABU3K995_9BACT|nr:response regulator [Candidatus Nitronereus thalassa]MDT7042960.1 response regulator [Candidatus Nitronereus thalassa]